MLKFLADVNIEKVLVEYLARTGFDVKWIPDYDCHMKDEELLQLANDEQRLLITNDTDFGELIFLQRKISSGIILLQD
jgi:predicted nuclease of predicted toxin-antitoxin system